MIIYQTVLSSSIVNWIFLNFWEIESFRLSTANSVYLNKWILIWPNVQARTIIGTVYTVWPSLDSTRGDIFQILSAIHRTETQALPAQDAPLDSQSKRAFCQQLSRRRSTDNIACCRNLLRDDRQDKPTLSPSALASNPHLQTPSPGGEVDHS